MKNTFNILFWLNRDKENLKGLAPIYCRITINGKRAEIATHHYIKPSKWDIQANKVKGGKGIVINESLDALKDKIRKVRDRLVSEGKFITTDVIRFVLNNSTKGGVGLIESAETLIHSMSAKVGTVYAEGYYANYKSTFKYLKLFVEKTMEVKDILLVMIEPKMFDEFENWIFTNTGKEIIKSIRN